jgi:hypothetical protein
MLPLNYGAAEAFATDKRSLEEIINFFSFYTRIDDPDREYMNMKRSFREPAADFESAVKSAREECDNVLLGPYLNPEDLSRGRNSNLGNADKATGSLALEVSSETLRYYKMGESPYPLVSLGKEGRYGRDRIGKDAASACANALFRRNMQILNAARIFLDDVSSRCNLIFTGGGSQDELENKVIVAGCLAAELGSLLDWWSRRAEVVKAGKAYDRDVAAYSEYWRYYNECYKAWRLTAIRYSVDYYQHGTYYELISESPIRESWVFAAPRPLVRPYHDFTCSGEWELDDEYEDSNFFRGDGQITSSWRFTDMRGIEREVKDELNKLYQYYCPTSPNRNAIVADLTQKQLYTFFKHNARDRQREQKLNRLVTELNAGLKKYEAYFPYTQGYTVAPRSQGKVVEASYFSRKLEFAYDTLPDLPDLPIYRDTSLDELSLGAHYWVSKPADPGGSVLVRLRARPDVDKKNILLEYWQLKNTERPLDSDNARFEDEIIAFKDEASVYFNSADNVCEFKYSVVTLDGRSKEIDGRISLSQPGDFEFETEAADEG